MDIQIKKLKKSYNQKLILDIDELRIPKHSIFALLGSNGAGKSTLGKIICNLEAPDSGDIYFNNQYIKKSDSKNITMVFQKPYMLRKTVRASIEYPLLLRGVSKSEAKERTQEVINRMNLEDISEQKAWTLSGGEMQKVALARATVFNPRLLVLDEPSASIDPLSLKAIEEEIQYVNKKDCTVLIITHNISQAHRIATHVAYMEKGVVIETGLAEKVLNFPTSTTTKRFLSGDIII